MRSRANSRNRPRTALHEAIRTTLPTRRSRCTKRATTPGYLKSFAVLKAPVDTFFDKVMVMVDDEKLRQQPPRAAARPARRHEPRRRPLEARHMKLVILDRDGTINQDSDQYIKSPAEWKPIPGSLRGDRAPHPGRLARRGRDQPVGHRARPVRHGDAERDPRRDAPRGRPGRRPHRRDFLLPARGGFRTASAASPSPACCSRSPRAWTSSLAERADGRRLAARPRGRRRGRARSRTWC